MARAARSLTHILPYFGDYKAHQVRADNVKNYVAHRLDQNAANATINRELSALKRMYNLGMQAEKIFRKPYIPMLQEHNVRQGFFERAEFLTLRAALPDYLKPVVTFAYFTGWRRGEIARAEVESGRSCGKVGADRRRINQEPQGADNRP